MSGILSMQHQCFHEAVDAFSKALRYGGDDRKCRVGLAMAYMGQSAANKAQAVLLGVLRGYPDDEEAIHWLIRACTALEDWGQLENALSYYVQRNPANCAVRFALASVQVKQCNVEDAKVHVRILQLLSPELDGLHDLRKVIESLEGNLEHINSERMSA